MSPEPPLEPIVAAPAELDGVRFNSDGLVPAIAQEATTGEVLMMAWMTRESLEMTLAERRMVYWSRSRNELWRKGDTSGDHQMGGVGLDHAILRTDREVVTGNMVALGVTGN